MLAQRPDTPHSLEALWDLPQATDAFVRDQFGFRDRLMRINARLRKSLNDDSLVASNVVTGRDGFLLLREGLLQSIGVETSPSFAQRDGALVCEMQRRLEREHIRFVYAIAPATTTIYPEAAPEAMGALGASTDYDLLIAAARSCGADAIDLRTTLRAQRHAHLLYRRTDTHWTPRGALIAYNEIAAHLQPGFRIDTASIPWRMEERLGDLTRMANADDTTRERVETPDLDQLTTVAPSERILPGNSNYGDGFIRDYPRPGLSVLIIGDSFAHGFFPDYLAPFVRRISYIHHQRCAFDWSDVERAAPDIVIFMPTERYAICVDGARPTGLDGN